MRILLIAVGKIKQPELADLEKMYTSRIANSVELTIREVRAENLKASERRIAIELEGDRILSNIPPEAPVWAMDLHGREMNSEQFAARLQTTREEGRDPLVLVVGGTFGLAPQVLARANLRISFSKLTFPHELFRIALLEQVFRAFKIIKNEPYHY